MRFCIELYTIQMEAGRCFLHEHPEAASSWAMPEVVKMLTLEHVDLVTCDMCAFGMKINDPEGNAPAKKGTKLMSNSPEVLKRVNKRCTNSDPEAKMPLHRHADTLCGRAKK